MGSEGWVIGPGYVFVRPEGEDEPMRQALAWRFVVSGNAVKGPQLACQVVALRADGTLEVVTPAFVSWGKPGPTEEQQGARRERMAEVDGIVYAQLTTVPEHAVDGWRWQTPELRATLLDVLTERELRDSITRLAIAGKVFPSRKRGGATTLHLSEEDRDGWEG